MEDTQQKPHSHVPVSQSEEVRYAGFWLRVWAEAIDSIILFSALNIIAFVLGTGEPENTSILLLGGWLYYAFQESGDAQATIGKRTAGIAVTNLSGGKITFWNATGRYYGKILSVITLFIGYFMVIWTDKKQALHDKVARTLVVRKK